MGVAAAFAALPACASATTRYVATTGADAPGCANSAAPCAHIQYAANQAANGDTIQIAAGTYTEAVGTAKTLTFVGAGAGTLSDPSGATVVQGLAGPAGSTGSPAFSLLAGGTLRSLRAEGGRGGDSMGLPGGSGGAGVAILAAPGGTSTTLDDVVALGGTGGAGIFPGGTGGAGLAAFSGSSGDEDSVHITGSAIASGTGGIFGDNAGLEAQGPGTSVFIGDSQIVQSGLAAAVGALQATEGAQVTLETSTAEGPVAATVSGSSLTARRSKLSGEAIGLSLRESSAYPGSAELDDSLVTVVNASHVGAAAAVEALDAGLAVALSARGTTFAATGSEAAVLARRSASFAAPVSITLRNSIADHTPLPGYPAADLLADRATIAADFSAFQDSVADNGGNAPAAGSAANVAAAPGFADAADGDFSLVPSSPLIDRGDPGAVEAGELDLAGSARSLDGNRDCLAAPDIGAYELTGQSAACPPPPPPVISSFRMTHRVFAPAGAKRKRHGARASRRRHRRAKRGTRFLYTVSEPASVTIAVERRQPGRKVGKGRKAHCAKQTRRNRHAKRCARYVRRARLREQASEGANSTPFSGRVKGKALKPGRYRATIVATDSAGQRSKPRRIAFRIVRG